MAIDLVALANKIKGQQAAAPSLVPTTSLNYADLLPARPTYRPYEKQEFDDRVIDGPGASSGWTWKKGAALRQMWNDEQNRKADEVMRQYESDLAAWQDAVNLAKAEEDRRRQDLKNYNEHLSAQGLTPAVSLYDPSPVVRQAQFEWQKAQAAGNKQAMDYWHNVAEQARIGAGWGSGGIDGSITAGRLTAAGLPTWERQYKETAYNDALKQQDLENSMKVAALTARGSGGGSGSGGGGSGSPDDFPYFLDTQGERTNVMTGSLLERAEAQYQLNRQRGGSAGKNPLYYTLNTLFNNPEWQRAATSSGADIKKVADYLIVKYAKMSPVDYFAAGKASGTPVAAAYKQLLTQEEQDRFYSPVATGKKQSPKGSFLNIFK